MLLIFYYFKIENIPQSRINVYYLNKLISLVKIFIHTTKYIFLYIFLGYKQRLLGYIPLKQKYLF